MSTTTTLGGAAKLIRQNATECGKPRQLIGIAGPPGAGKTTIAQKLVQLLGPRSAVLGVDGFHLPQRTLVALGKRERMGAPDTFDVDALVSLLIQLTGNAAVTATAPEFDRTVEESIPDALSFGPGISTIIVEGNYLLHNSGGWQRVAPLIDMSFFVKTEHDVRLARLIERHVSHGKTPDAALAWATGPDAANARLIDETAERADHVIDLAP